MSDYTDEQVREFARRVVLSCTEDIDYMGVGEQFEDEWKDLSEEEFDDLRSRVHSLTTWATVTVSWPERTPALLAEVELLRAELADLRGCGDCMGTGEVGNDDLQCTRCGGAGEDRS